MEQKINELNPVSDRIQSHVDESVSANRIIKGKKVLQWVLIGLAIVVVLPFVMLAVAGMFM